MKSRRKKILLGLLGLLIVLQFIPIDRSVPEIQPSQDFLQIVNAPEGMANLIKNACYDCHSYESEYPWYAKIAPVSFLIKSHIKGGREEMNFSEWGTYSKEKTSTKLEECFKMVNDREMPMKSFVFMHPEAKMTDVQVTGLAQWFQQLYRAETTNSQVE